jgi:hypothetical protein
MIEHLQKKSVDAVGNLQLRIQRVQLRNPSRICCQIAVHIAAAIPAQDVSDPPLVSPVTRRTMLVRMLAMC